MHKRAKLYMITFLCVFGFSCMDSGQHHKDLAFYVFLQSKYKKDFSPQLGHLKNIMDKYMDVEKAHGWHYIDTTVCDTFRETLGLLNKMIKEQESEIDTIQEVDPDINLKEKSLTFYRHCDKATMKMALFFDKLFRKGIDAMTDEELHENTDSTMIDEINRLAEVKELFKEKHHITNAELQPYGL